MCWTHAGSEPCTAVQVMRLCAVICPQKSSPDARACTMCGLREIAGRFQIVQMGRCLPAASGWLSKHVGAVWCVDGPGWVPGWILLAAHLLCRRCWIKQESSCGHCRDGVSQPGRGTGIDAPLRLVMVGGFGLPYGGLLLRMSESGVWSPYADKPPNGASTPYFRALAASFGIFRRPDRCGGRFLHLPPAVFGARSVRWGVPTWYNRQL